MLILSVINVSKNSGFKYLLFGHSGPDNTKGMIKLQ